jgi:hypothetical protein
MLLGVACFDLFLFHVETHRQRSERFEVHGAYLDPHHQPVKVGVGYPDLDVRLEGTLYDLDRWSLGLRSAGAGRWVLADIHQVDMVRLPSEVWWKPWSHVSRPVLGARLSGGSPTVSGQDSDGVEFQVRLLPEGARGVLVWEGSRVPLDLPDGILDRRLSRSLSVGVSLADLDWDSLPDTNLARDLVLTRVRRGRSFGRFRLLLPEYRLVARDPTITLATAETPVIPEGDTVSITSRGKTWAFALDRVPGVSRVSAPVAVRFVRRPRPSGWALPSPEACGEDAHRCAVVSSHPLPPPQPHFDLSGFGLDTARYSVLARLETTGEGVRLVGADSRASFGYGEYHPLPALAASEDVASAGILVRVHRSARGQQSAVFLTVFALFCMVLGSLVTLSGDPGIWKRRRASSPSMTAAWGFLNLFLVFLGVRLALGLRVAYSLPFYDRAATTAIGLWVTFAIMLVALGRWSAWTPLFWRTVRRLETPASRLFLPWVNGRTDPRRRGASPDPPAEGDPPLDPVLRRKGRGRTAYGLALLFVSLGFVVWQRPETLASLVVAATGLGAWLVMGVGPRSGTGSGRSRYPLSVVTQDGDQKSPHLSFTMTAGAAVVLALAIHTPWMALAPLLALLLLFGSNYLLGRWRWTAPPRRRGWFLLGLMVLMLALAAVALLEWPWIGGAVVIVAGAAAALVLRKPSTQEAGSRLEVLYGDFLSVGRVIFSGVGWIGVVVVLGALVFLGISEIPPFVRFALVFTLFLLAIRAGLVCQRVLERGEWRGQLQALGLLVIPLGVLFVFMLFDFGLGLVFFVPMFITVLLAARIDRLPWTLTAGSVALVVLITLVTWSVLRPPLQGIRNAQDLPTFAAEFEGVGNGVSDLLRMAGMSTPVIRASIRSVAASDPELLEEALAFAGPSEALFAAAPSREQVWGGRAYASAGLTGTGFAGTTALGRGIPTSVSYAENTFSVYVLAEHGALGGAVILLMYLTLLVVVAVWITRVHRTIQETRLGLAVLAMTVGGVLWLTLPAVYVAASNLGLVPLTGQNMPFLGLNSWADVVLVSGLSTGVVFGLAAQGGGMEEGRES